MCLDEKDFAVDAEFLQALLEERVARMFVSDDVGEVLALGCAIFDMPHVEIEPRAVEEETAIARRFVVIAVVKIDQPKLLFLEGMIADTGRHRRQPEGFGSQTTVFRFDSSEAVHKLGGIFDEMNGIYEIKTGWLI